MLRLISSWIEYVINKLATKGISAALADPIGIYINNFDTQGFKLDSTGDESQLLNIPEGTIIFRRGDVTKGQALRLKIEILQGVRNTEGRQLAVSDIYDTKNETFIWYG